MVVLRVKAGSEDDLKTGREVLATWERSWITSNATTAMQDDLTCGCSSDSHTVVWVWGRMMTGAKYG